jgi:hypothetical protein
MIIDDRESAVIAGETGYICDLNDRRVRSTRRTRPAATMGSLGPSSHFTAQTASQIVLLVPNFTRGAPICSVSSRGWRENGDFGQHHEMFVKIN